jgi:hypothetical protein
MRGVGFVIGIWTATSIVIGPIVGLWLRRVNADAQAAGVSGHGRRPMFVVI